MADRLGSFLHLATEAEAHGAIQQLLEVGANVNHVNADEDEETPLLLACAKGPVNIVQLFIENGADIHARDKHGYSALHRPCNTMFHRWNGADLDADLVRLEKVRLLIAHGVDPNDDQNAEGDTALHLAALDGYEEAVRFLVESGGASVDPVNNEGETPLHLACQNDHLNIVQFLVQNGAQVGWETLEKVCQACRLGILEWLAANGATLNITNDQGRTFLHHAVLSSRHLELLEALYQYGIDINARDKNGMTPVLGAFLVDHTSDYRYEFHGDEEREWSIRLETIQSLAEHGADLNLADNQGVTPLHQACQRGHLEVVQFLLTRGANVDTKTKQGLTPLHLACLENHSDVVWCLVRQSLWLLSPADAT